MEEEKWGIRIIHDLRLVPFDAVQGGGTSVKYSENYEQVKPAVEALTSRKPNLFLEP